MVHIIVFVVRIYYLKFLRTLSIAKQEVSYLKTMGCECQSIGYVKNRIGRFAPKANYPVNNCFNLYIFTTITKKSTWVVV